MTEIKYLDGRLYVSAIFDCFDCAVPGLAMGTNMKATLCEKTLENTYKPHPGIRGCILHPDKGTQYTSELYRNAISKYGIIQGYFISYWNNRRICSASGGLPPMVKRQQYYHSLYALSFLQLLYSFRPIMSNPHKQSHGSYIIS